MGASRSAPRSSTLGPTTPVPDRLYFKIGEVARLVGVQTHVLRYWERHIPSVRPGKTPSNQRRYRRRDVELLREVRRLLHEEHLTLAGARRWLNVPGDKPEVESPPSRDLVETNRRRERLRAGLQELVRLAGEDP